MLKAGRCPPHMVRAFLVGLEEAAERSHKRFEELERLAEEKTADFLARCEPAEGHDET